MKLNELLTDDNAVSPVIGVILMVAITVILAAVIGTFVLGLGGQVQNNAPTTDFTFDENSSHIDITHTSGQQVEIDNLGIVADQASLGSPCASDSDWSDDDSTITAGDTCSVSNPGSSTTIRVTWESNDGSTSDTMAEYEYEA
jgi:flagellin-like protein